MTRQAAPTSRPVVLTIAGSDSGGGAGIQADLKTIEACGGFGTSAITSVTAQNTTGVESTHVLPVAEVDAQCEAVLSDFEVGAVKTGMLATSDVVELVTDTVRETDTPAVVDPVMVAASGDRLLARAAESAYEELVAEATLVTPNADEAAVLTDVDPADEADARAAGERLVDMGADAALVKGGHLSDEDVVDVLVTGERVETFRHERVETDATHGSGCALSSAIATRLAQGEALVDAVGSGIDLLARAVRYNVDVGQGPGSVHHLVELRNDGARDRTAEEVRDAVDRIVDRGVAPLVPEVGTNVVGATPFAERPDEVAAVDGRITRTLSGAAACRDVRFGASTHVARALLSARERDPELRFALDCRYDAAVADALGALDGPVEEFDAAADAGRGNDATDPDAESRSDADDPHAGRETHAVERAVARAFDACEGTPVVVVRRGADGSEPIAYLFARDADALVERTVAVLDALAD